MGLQLQAQTDQTGGIVRLEFGGDVLTAPTFRWSIYPDAPVGIRVSAPSTLVSPNIYDVDMGDAGFAYLWVTDGATTYDPVAVTEIASTDPRMVQTGDALRQRIEDNLAEIQHYLDQHTPEDHRKIRVVGYKTELDEATPPWIVLTKGSRQSVPAGIGGLMDNTYQFTIALCATVTDDPEDRTPAVSAMVDSLVSILNRARYRSLTLPSGCQLGDCMAVRGTAETVQTTVTGGYRYFSIGSITWQGKLWAVEA